MSDRIFGAVGLLVSAFYIWAALQTQESFLSDAVGPKTFPVIIGTILAIASLVVILRPDAEPVWPAMGQLAEIAIAVVVMVLYAQLLPEIGFVIATAGAASVLSWRLGSPPVQAGLVGVGISLGIYGVFHLLFGLSLARGPLGF